MANIPPVPSRILPINQKDSKLAEILNSIYREGWKNGYEAAQKEAKRN